MKKFGQLSIAISLVMTMLFSTPESQADAAEMTATIDINTSVSTHYNTDFRGYNNEAQRTAVTFASSELKGAVGAYGPIGFVRWPGGTPTNGFSWKLGMTDAEFTGQVQGEARRYYNQLYARRYSQAKGFDTVSDYRSFLQETGAKAVVLVNVFQQNPEQARDLAKYLRENHVPVLYFELGNEVSFYVAESGNQQPVYQTGTDYLDRVRVFNDVIKNEYPGAKTVISMSNFQVASFDEDVFNYPNPYWDAITTHRFRGDGSDAASAMTDANGYLNSWQSSINYYTNSLPDSDVFIGEHGVRLGGLLDNTQYHGIYVSESVLRLLGHPNIPYLAGYRLTNGLFTPANGHATSLEDAYQDGVTLDTSGYNFDSYLSAPNVALQIVDSAVNRSTTVWQTNVIGGTTVARPGGTMPALYARALRGEDGKNYVLVTNKSSDSHEVTIQMDGASVSSPMTATYASHADPLARNSSNSPATVATEVAPTGNPVVVPPYSVVRLEWTRTTQADAPRPTVLMYADATNGGAALRWQRSMNASGYKVRYGTSPGNYSQTIDVGNALEWQAVGLSNGSAYYFAVAPYNSSGESAPSNEVAVELSAPDAPMARRAYAERERNIAVEWQSVAGATGYKLKYGTAPGVYSTVIDVGNNVGRLVTGLASNTTYYFTVSAYNGIGEGLPSAEMSAVTNPTLPLAPHHAEIVSETASSVSITWRPTLANTYHDYFEDGVANNWTQESGSWSIVEDTTRSATFYQSALDFTSVAIFGGSATGDYEGEAMIERAAVPTGRQAYAYGVVARYTDTSNYYKFIYNLGEDRFKIVKVAGGVETVLASKTRTEVLNAAKATTLDLDRLHLFLRVEGDRLTGSVNQLGPILAVMDGTHPSGKFGLYTLNVQARYDWARLYRDNADTFTVYRSAQPHTNFVVLQSDVAGTSFTDSGLASGATYYYRVTASNVSGDSYHHSNVLRKN